MNASRINVLVLGGEAAAAQRKLVDESVLPRFAQWCRRLGLDVRAAHAERADARGFLEVRLPVRTRSSRVSVADQIYADLRAMAAARHPDRLAAAMSYQLRPPEPVTQPDIACVTPPPRPASRGSSPPAPGPPAPEPGCGLTTILPAPKVVAPAPVPRPRMRRKLGAMIEPGPLIAINFEVRTGGGVEKRRVAARRITLGRMPTCDVPVLDPSVSRKHALIEVWTDGCVVIKDLGSSNCVYVNGQKVEACELKSGDTIRLGSAEVRVTFPRSKA